jgi:hypothetical protein
VPNAPTTRTAIGSGAGSDTVTVFIKRGDSNTDVDSAFFVAVFC